MRPGASSCRAEVPPAPGGTFTQSDLARTLEAIARDGAEAFYRGGIADLIERDMEAHGGLMTREDLGNYVARIRPPGTRPLPRP